MNNPKISVIVPIYNIGQYLSRCIDSILVQTFTNFELLLIDDGSTDNSGRICDDYAKKDNRIRVFHKKNGGVALARQLGIENAIGEYSIHADGDDWVEANMLENMYKKIVESNADVLIADFYFDKNNKSSYIRQNGHEGSSQEILKKIFRGKIFGSLWHKMIRHSLYKKFNVHFIPHIDYCEDVLVLCQILQHDVKVEFLHKAYYHYDHHNAMSITCNYNQNTYKIRQQYVEELINILPQDFDDIKNFVMYQIKREGFINGYLDKVQFYTYKPESFNLSNIFSEHNIRVNICMLLAYIGLFSLAKRFIHILRLR